MPKLPTAREAAKAERCGHCGNPDGFHGANCPVTLDRIAALQASMPSNDEDDDLPEPEGALEMVAPDATGQRNKQDRISVVSNVYHQAFGEEPTNLKHTFTRILTTTEQQPWTRKCKATEQWKPVDLGWFDEEDAVPAGMVVISNEEGRVVLTNPTAEEAEALAKRIIHIGFAKTNEEPEFWQIVYPREAVTISPSQATALKVRCACSVAKFTLTALPS